MYLFILKNRLPATIIISPEKCFFTVMTEFFESEH